MALSCKDCRHTVLPKHCSMQSLVDRCIQVLYNMLYLDEYDTTGTSMSDVTPSKVNNKTSKDKEEEEEEEDGTTPMKDNSPTGSDKQHASALEELVYNTLPDELLIRLESYGNSFFVASKRGCVTCLDRDHCPLGNTFLHTRLNLLPKQEL